MKLHLHALCQFPVSENDGMRLDARTHALRQVLPRLSIVGLGGAGTATLHRLDEKASRKLPTPALSPRTLMSGRPFGR